MASSSSTRHQEYDVFLSFRGQDTRKTIVSHLHRAFVNKGIITFKDDRELEMGNSISDEIGRAIEDSKFAVVVISENYTSSWWCLDELRLIMELQGKEKLIAVPIFYGVDPSDVRHHRGSFDLERYQGSRMAEKVPKWREALAQVANLSGADSRQCMDEATMIDDIVGGISSRLLSLQPIDFVDIFGMDSHMEQMTPLLNMKSEDEVCMIGIWGMGGIGKTTIAKCLYDQYSRGFSAHCFLEDVKKISREHGLLYLQEQLLSKVLCEEHVKLWSMELGSQIIKSRLGHRKVFIVLDDVDNMNQLHALAKETSWFGPGSRIIITTRDKGLLNCCGVGTIYKVKFMGNDDAFEMFKQFAFEGGCPPSAGFEQLAMRATQLAQGLPSAVEAFSLYLRGKSSLKEWEDALHRFERAPHRNIMEILKLSYNGLDAQDRAVFLHVACLFNGGTLQHVITLLDDGISEANLSIKVLVEKSLIDISSDGRITMHDLVEQMGREIVRQESGNRPWEQRILWDPQEAYDVLADKAGTKQIECVALHLCELPDKLSMRISAFEPMRNLKFLKFYKHFPDIESMIQLIPDVDLLPRKLRLLHWDTYPLTTLPSTFHPHHLVELSLRYSDLESLWDGTPDLRVLRRLDLTGSKNLREPPDLSRAVWLEELIMEGCTRLERFPESNGYLSLKNLNISHCDGIKNLLVLVKESIARQDRIGKHCRVMSLQFPNEKMEVKFLTQLSISSKIVIKLFKQLEGKAEHLSFCSERQEPDDSIARKQVDLQDSVIFYHLKSLDIKRFNYDENGAPFRCYSFSEFPCLKELSLINLNIPEIPDDIHHLILLEKLDLSGNDFKNLPATMDQLSELKCLGLRDCRNLKALPRLTQLETLSLSNCISLQSLVELSDVADDLGIYHLLELGLDNCKNVRSLAHQLSRFTSLAYLDLSRHDFETVPKSITELSSLRTLCLNNCKNLKSLAELPLSLKYLYADGCVSLDTFSLLHNHSLKHLDLSNCFRLNQDASLINQSPTDGCIKEESRQYACLPGTGQEPSSVDVMRGLP